MRSQTSLLERMMLATESGGIGVWDWHVRDGRLDWKAQMYELFGLPPGPERTVPDRWLDRVHEQDRPAIERSLGEVARSGSVIVSTLKR